MTRQLEPDQLPGTPGGDRLICAECTINEDPAPWCDCLDGEQCRGPCRKRAHGPDRCPFRDAYVPVMVRWSQVKAGDVIQGRGGVMLLVMGAVGDVDDEDRPYGLITWSVKKGPQTLQAPKRNPDHPVPVLVPYAERAALVTLRAGGTGPTLLERP